LLEKEVLKNEDKKNMVNELEQERLRQAKIRKMLKRREERE
jgi:hypothetical protein